MPFTDPTMLAAIAAAAASAVPEARAVGHNFTWDERLSANRVAAYEQPPYVPTSPDVDALIEGYRSYFTERLEWDGKSNPLPEAFQALNGGAAFTELPDDGQRMVRIVKVRPETLAAANLTYDGLVGAVDLVRASAASDTEAQLKNARSALENFVEKWNAFDRRPPAFVGFETDVAAELATSDWPHEIRDRFGIGHLHPVTGAITVMLLSYTVKEMLKLARRYCQPLLAMRVPTVLDSNLYEYFYPSPTPLPYGRTVDLQGGLNDEKLTCELIHLPVDLKVDHIRKLGQITKPIPSLPLAQLRNDHLWILRYVCVRNNWGQMM